MLQRARAAAVRVMTAVVECGRLLAVNLPRWVSMPENLRFLDIPVFAPAYVWMTVLGNTRS